MTRLEAQEFVVIGHGCPLLDDPEKALEVNEGHSLVPWSGQKSLLIDRYDCRAYLQDITEYDHAPSLNQEDYLSEEEVAIEKMCEFERYLELQVDVDDMTTQAEEEKKREAEALRSKYGAVDFSYDESTDGHKDSEAENGGTPADTESNTEEAASDPYIIPPELKHLEVQFPDTDKQAQIIERTAVFVSRQGSQMEIVLKAKQTSNPLFGFLNYDHDLNPFYKEMVKLIRQGRYIPKVRPSKPEIQPSDSQVEPNKSIQDDHYELKLPKVDISNTAYASLINKFKKVNELASQAQAAAASQPSPPNLPAKESPPPESHTEVPPAHEKPETEASTEHQSTSPREKDNSNSLNVDAESAPNPDSTTSPTPCAAPVDEYEQCYQEYYKHYYSHYYTQFSDQQSKLAVRMGTSVTDEQRESIVQQAAKAAAVAASAAVNAMYQARLAQKSAQSNQSMTVTMTPGERGIIDKMAEYVARNGIEFEELVTRQKGGDARFGFLKPNHPHHSYYLSRRRQLLPDPPDTSTEKPSSVTSTSSTPERAEQTVPHKQPVVPTASAPKVQTSDSPTSETPSDRQLSISFKLTRPCSSTKLHSTPASEAAPPSVYVHSSIPMEYGVASSCPNLGKEYNSPTGPTTPMNSVVSDDDVSGSVGSHRDHSKSPVRFSLPGIPSAYSSSSASPVSSRSRSPSGSSPERSRDSSPPSPIVKVQTPKEKPRPRPPRRVTKYDRKKSEEPMINPLMYPRTDIPCAYNPPSPVRSPEVKSDIKSSPRTPPLGSTAIEHILDTLEDSNGLTRSPDRRKSSKSEERLRQERRKRAAQLVAQLRTSASSANMPNTARSDHSDVRASASMANLSVRSSPPPAPDSVPAAVAHAVVASLKRRHEESLASLEAEAKVRKRMRSPPSAYALPKERSHKSSSSRDSSRHSRSPPPLREMIDSPERKRSKHKKHHVSHR